MSDIDLIISCEESLEECLQILGLSLGIVSKIDQSSYLLLAVKSDTGAFKAGDAFGLMDTYCREVYERQRTIAFTQYDNTPGMSKHPLYAGLPLESYISAPIIVAGKVWGTLNFSSLVIRDKEFTREEIDLVETKANQIAELISKSMQ